MKIRNDHVTTRNNAHTWFTKLTVIERRQENSWRLFLFRSSQNSHFRHAVDTLSWCHRIICKRVLIFEQTRVETESNTNRIDDLADFARVGSDFDGVSVLFSTGFWPIVFLDWSSTYVCRLVFGWILHAYYFRPLRDCSCCNFAFNWELQTFQAIASMEWSIVGVDHDSCCLPWRNHHGDSVTSGPDRGLGIRCVGGLYSGLGHFNGGFSIQKAF